MMSLSDVNETCFFNTETTSFLYKNGCIELPGTPNRTSSERTAHFKALHLSVQEQREINT